MLDSGSAQNLGQWDYAKSWTPDLKRFLYIGMTRSLDQRCYTKSCTVGQRKILDIWVRKFLFFEVSESIWIDWDRFNDPQNTSESSFRGVECRFDPNVLGGLFFAHTGSPFPNPLR